MRQQLIEYVKLLFAGSPDTDDMQQEILQNTLDRYDDLVAQGKTPEAAYRLAIAGIGDIGELLGTPAPAPTPIPDPANRFKPEYRSSHAWKKLVRAIAVCLYIISVIPLFVLSELGMDTIGLCGTIAIVAVATVLIMLSSGGKSAPKQERALSPQQEIRKAIRNVISTVGLVLYFTVSFATDAWMITWLIFPIMGAVQGVVTAVMDLKEAGSNEN